MASSKYFALVLGFLHLSHIVCFADTSMTLLQENGKIEIRSDHIALWLSNYKGNFVKTTIRIPKDATETPHITETKDHFKADWENGFQLSIHTIFTETIKSYHLEMSWTNTSDTLKTCIELDDANWYGGAETHFQGWPIQNYFIPEVDFIPNAINGGVLDRYFLNSNGESYFLNDTEPLFVSLSPGNELCFTTAFIVPYRNTDGRELSMSLYVVTAENILEAHKYGLQNYFSRPAGIPAEKVFRNPIWSTWAQYKTEINQSTVLDFTQQIDDHGFPVSQIEIDDNWETCYGNEDFDTLKFPNASEMVNDLKEKGHDVTLWIHPFINTDCALFEEGDTNNYFVTSDGYNVTGLTHWWDGVRAGIIDITKSDAADWWFERLNGLRTDVGITAFKFDAGEARFLPLNAYLNSSEDLQPGIYSTLYARFANQFGGQVEGRVGYRSQDVAIFVRMLDRDSRWGLDNGLHSVLTSTLHMGLVGSPFVLPDYIGGNAYGIEYPDKELFIRWVELTAFLPVMQFSITPWSYDDEVVDICYRMVELHQNISDVIVAAANQATVDGFPIIRPLWWIDPYDVTAQITNDEFMVGDLYLVAPVITKGSVERDVYLPVGNWSDELRGGIIEGPTWLRNYSVALYEISFFSSV